MKQKQSNSYRLSTPSLTAMACLLLAGCRVGPKYTQPQ